MSDADDQLGGTGERERGPDPHDVVPGKDNAAPGEDEEGAGDSEEDDLSRQSFPASDPPGQY